MMFAPTVGRLKGDGQLDQHGTFSCPDAEQVTASHSANARVRIPVTIAG